MRKNSIDIYTSQHVYPANSFREFALGDLILVLFLVKGVKLQLHGKNFALL